MYLHSVPISWLISLDISWLNYLLQSTLSKAEILGTKSAVRFREVSGLESVRLERVDCISHFRHS